MLLFVWERIMRKRATLTVATLEAATTTTGVRIQVFAFKTASIQTATTTLWHYHDMSCDVFQLTHHQCLQNRAQHCCVGRRGWVLYCHLKSWLQGEKRSLCPNEPIWKALLQNLQWPEGKGFEPRSCQKRITLFNWHKKNMTENVNAELIIDLWLLRRHGNNNDNSCCVVTTTAQHSA